MLSIANLLPTVIGLYRYWFRYFNNLRSLFIWSQIELIVSQDLGHNCCLYVVSKSVLTSYKTGASYEMYLNDLYWSIAMTFMFFFFFCSAASLPSHVYTRYRVGLVPLQGTPPRIYLLTLHIYIYALPSSLSKSLDLCKHKQETSRIMQQQFMFFLLHCI